MLDVDALVKRVSESTGGPSVVPAPANPDAPSESAGPTMAELGARLRAARAHGDDEAEAQAILEIVHRGR